MLNDVSKNEALIDDCWVNMPATATEAIPLINVIYDPTSDLDSRIGHWINV